MSDDRFKEETRTEEERVKAFTDEIKRKLRDGDKKEREVKPERMREPGEER